ncbi:MAG: type II toxin-antitoxin system VapC family toxin [Acidiferrobacteraceae bacterium]
MSILHVLRVIPTRSAHEYLFDLLDFDSTSIPTQVLADDALRIALKRQITTSDALYVAAASQQRFLLFIADEKLVRQMEIGPHDVPWLWDVVPTHS